MSAPTPLPDTPTARSAAPIFIGGFVMMLLFFLGTRYMISSRPEPINEETIRHAERAEIIDKVNEQAAADLNRFAWVDQAKGLAQVPVEYAMKLEVEALRSAPGPRPAYPTDPMAAAEFLAQQKAAAEAAANPPATENTPPPDSSPAGAPTSATPDPPAP